VSTHVPRPPSPPPRAAGGPAPLLVALAAAALAVLFVCGVGVAVLLLRGGHRAPPQQVVGAAIPGGWVPGRGGAGAPPPPPSSGPAAPVGAPPPLPSAAPEAPADHPPGELGEPDAQATPGQPGLAPGPVEQPPAAESFVPPRLINLPTPEYPAVGQRMGVEGTVVLQVLVAADGHVLEANPIGERLGMGFEASARRAAFAARFEPARRNGEPVDAETRIAIRFRLQ